MCLPCLFISGFQHININLLKFKRTEAVKGRFLKHDFQQKQEENTLPFLDRIVFLGYNLTFAQRFYCFTV
jgi:hypothetical protein